MKYLFIVFLTGASLVACSPETTEVIQITETIEATDENGMMKADIGEGKVIFMRDCTRCHEQKKVEDFTTTQWSNILPRMIIQAQLNDTENRQVTAYIEWELEN